MSNSAMAIAMHHSRATGTARLVLFIIADHDGDGGAWPSVRTIAKCANVDERNVRRGLQRLQSLGEVFVHLQAGGTHRTADHRRPNLYQFLLSCPEDCDRSKQHRSRQEVLWEKRDPVLFDPLAVAPPPGGSAPPPPGGSAPRTTQEEPPSEQDHAAVAQGETSAREVEPVDNRPVGVTGKTWCNCVNGWLPPAEIDVLLGHADEVPPRPCLRCKPHLAKSRRVRLGVTR